MLWFFVLGEKVKLNLDEKKIRKGKPVGLPYQGSKKKISKKIVEIIKQNFGTDKPIYDIFGGGGAITAECILNGLDVHYNDLDKTITKMFCKVVTSDREWIKTLIVSREDFFDIRAKETKTVDDELKLLVNSFGNDRTYYLYGKEHGSIKYNLAVKVINEHDCFSGYKRTLTYKDEVKKLQRLQQSERLQQLQQLTQLQQLERLQQLTQPESVTNLSYESFSYINNSILYLDPPYENARSKYKFKFDSSKFYDWAFEMSKNNIVLISSYEITDDRFKEVYSFDKARSTLQGGTSKGKCERLFMVNM